MNRDISLYSEITDADCEWITGKTLKGMYSQSTGFHQLSFEVVKNNRREKNLYEPHTDLNDEKLYKCFEYGRVSGAGIDYTTIAILNY